MGPLGGATIAYVRQVAQPGAVIEFDQMVTVGMIVVPAGGASSGGYSWGPASSASITAGAWPAPPFSTLHEMFSPPPFVAPPPSWCLGPKSATITVNYYSTRARATNADPGVVFYRWGLEPTVGCRAYWEFVASEAGDTLGGFGVGGVLTATDSEPGKGANPGALLYREGGVWSIWMDGVETVVAGAATPTRIGVGVQAIAQNALSVQWWLDGQLLNAVPVTWIFDGALWVPVLCTLSDAVTFTLDDAL
jgi:hypothetical protein